MTFDLEDPFSKLDSTRTHTKISFNKQPFRGVQKITLSKNLVYSKDHSKSKGFIVRHHKLLLASHNIFFVLLIIKEFESLWAVVKNAYLTLFYFSMYFARSVNVRKRDKPRQEKPTNIRVTFNRGIIYHSHSLREKCQNTEVFLVRIFTHSDWIRRDTEYSVWMRENTDQKNLCIWTLFTQWLS